MASRPPSPTASASLQVVVRLRPLNDKEKKHGTLPVVSASTADKTVTVIKGQGSRQVRSNYRFDNVFTAFSSQEEVFDETLKPVIRDVLRGFESTVFAYGQTGTGKTHTMEGDLSNPEMHGVIPRSAAAIFRELQSPEYISSTVSCSFLEIYNEDLCDLLADPVVGFNKQRPKLDIMEGKNGPFCRGLSEKTVESEEEVFSLMRKAQQQRQVGETNMNKQSSRSHCIFTIRTEAKKKLRDGSIMEVAGKLHCVDLAGSECAKSADLDKGNEAQAARERERLNINRSLLTLGRVVSMLNEKQSAGKKVSRIPYRDSKLTRILQESLGGRCKTCLIATVSPSVTAIEESMSTLNYAQAANGILNKPVTSSFMTQCGSFSCTDGNIMPTTTENSAYSVEHWQEMECRLQYMQTQVEEAQNALARKHLQQQELIEKADRAEILRQEAAEKHEEAMRQIGFLEEKIQVQAEKVNILDQELAKCKTTLRNTMAVLEATQHTEVCLTNEAKSLLGALKASIEESNKIYGALTEAREDRVQQKEASNVFKAALLVVFENILQKLNTIKATQQENRVCLLETFHANTTNDDTFLNEAQSIVDQTAQHVTEIVLLLKNQTDDGILSSLSSMGTSSRGYLQQIDESACSVDREVSLSNESIREDLSNAVIRIIESEKKYMESSSAFLSSLEKSFHETKQSFNDIVASSNNSLTKCQEETTLARKNFDNIAAEWLASNLGASQNIQNLVVEEKGSVERMLDVLKLQVQKHDEIRNHLSHHSEFIENSRVSHLEGLEKQALLLKSQRDNIGMSFEKNKQFCQELVDNVMVGVQQLLQTQMNKITKQNEESLALLMSTHESVIGTNACLSLSTNTILGDIAASNSTVQEYTKCAHENDSKAINVFNTTKKSLDSIQETSTKMASDSSIFRNATSKAIEEAEKLNTKNFGEIKLSLSDGSMALGNHLSEKIFRDVQDGINELSVNTKSNTAFVTENVIPGVTGKITDTIEIPISASLNKIREDAKNVISTIDMGQKIIEQKASEHNDTLTNFQSDITLKTNKLSNNFAAHKKIIQSRENNLSRSIDTHEVAMINEVSKSSEQVSNGKETLFNFVENVVKADEPVPELGSRGVPSFSEKLSSTPSEYEILKNASMHIENGFAEKENAPLEVIGPTTKDRRSFSAESALTVISGNSFENSSPLNSDRVKRRSDIMKTDPKRRRSKKLRLSIPKADTM